MTEMLSSNHFLILVWILFAQKIIFSKCRIEIEKIATAQDSPQCPFRVHQSRLQISKLPFLCNIHESVSHFQKMYIVELLDLPN